MKKILIGGCSFSQEGGHGWKSWTDFLKDDGEEKFQIINKAQGSFGQSLIVESLLSELILRDFNIDYVIVQWSAVGRAYSTNQKDFFDRMIRQWEPQFSPHQQEYLVSGDTEGWLTNIMNTIEPKFYTASLNQILLFKSLLEVHNIPFTFFWGWEQITEDLMKKNNNLINKIYDERFWRWKENGGMMEYVIDTIGYDKGIIPNDFHPTTKGHEIFYNHIVKDIINQI